MSQDNPLLTDREITVLRYVAQGWNSRAISRRIHVQVRTIHYYYKNIKNKLGVTTIEEVMFIAGRDNLLGEYLPDEPV